MEYSSRRVYTSSSPRPKIASSYSYTTPIRSRHFVATDLPGDRERIRDDGSSYTRSFTSTSSTNNRSLGGDDDGFGSSSGYGPRGSNNNSNNSENKSYFKKTETTTRDNGSGPQRQVYSSEKTTTRTDGDTPSFFSSTSYRTPQGSSFRHHTYK